MRHVVVAAPPDVTSPEDLERLPACADVVEVRLDLLPAAEGTDPTAWQRPRQTRMAYPTGRIFTLRSAAQGGGFRGSPAEAVRTLETFDLALPNFSLDVEESVLGLLGGGRRSALSQRRVVLARHGSFDPIPFPPDRVPAVVKRAARVDDAASLARFLDAIRATVDPNVGRAIVPFGPLGALRVLDPHAALLFGSAGTPVVEGQPTLLALLDELRAGEVTPAARLFGLLGSPPSASPSPALHNAVFRAFGHDAVHVPLPGLSLETALSLPFQGYSVTTPFKERALALADEADPRAREAGAANTLVRRPGGGWRATNTDVDGIESALPPAMAGARLVVFGSGGYARAALVAARARGWQTALVARNEARGRVVARSLGAAWGGTTYVRNAADRVLVNATPAGARGEPVPALGANFAGLTVLDAPYAEHGAPTWLVVNARAHGCRVVDGLTLLLAQAVGQAEAFTGSRPDPDVLAMALRPRTNLVLAGLRGAGKTTVGRLVAERLGRPFVDLDEDVRRVSGRTPDEVIQKSGLAAFRREERWAVARLGGRRGLVVATGGGVVEDPRNVPRLRALGPCVWLDVPAGVAGARVQADPTPRPPLTADPDPTAESRALLLRRSRRYGLLAHARVDATRAPEAVAREVAGLWVTQERAARSPSGC